MAAAGRPSAGLPLRALTRAGEGAAAGQEGGRRFNGAGGERRKNTDEDYKEYPKRLVAEPGVESRTDEEVRRFDKRRKKKVSNKEWQSPADPHSRNARTKDGTTQRSCNAGHAKDLDTDFELSAAVYTADRFDCSTLPDGVLPAQASLLVAGGEPAVRDGRPFPIAWRGRRHSSSFIPTWCPPIVTTWSVS